MSEHLGYGVLMLAYPMWDIKLLERKEKKKKIL